MNKTPLYEKHIELNAKLVDFADYKMPIQYSGITKEHLAVRESAGIFDVSHMGEIIISGKGAEDFLEFITINDISSLEPWQVQYSAMCFEDGGIVDDLLIYKYPDYFMLVVNCSNTAKDFDWLMAHKPKDVNIIDLSQKIGLIALQGPKSREILNQIIDQGSTWSKQITVYETDGTTIQNLTGYTVASQLRKNYTSTAYTTINATNNSPTSGIIVMSLTATQTAALKSGRYVYDLQITAADGTVTRVIEGVITLRPEVTK